MWHYGDVVNERPLKLTKRNFCGMPESRESTDQLDRTSEIFRARLNKLNFN